MNTEYKRALAKAEENLNDIKMRGQDAIGQTWDELRTEIFTCEEIAAGDLRVALIGEFIKARQEKGLTQKELEKISGVWQPVINRMERGSTNT